MATNITTDPLLSVVQGYGNYGMGSQGIYDQSGKAVLPLIDAANAANDPRGTMAQILRGQWTDYETVFKPIKDTLEKYTTYNGNAGIQQELIDQGTKANNQAFDITQGMQQRQFAGLGMAPTAREQGALDKAATMNRQLAQADLENQARITQMDLNRQIAAGMPSRSEAQSAFK